MVKPSFREYYKNLIFAVTLSGLYMPSLEYFIKNRLITGFLKFMCALAIIFFVVFFYSGVKHLLFSDADFYVKTYDIAMMCGNSILTFKIVYYNIYRHRFEKLFTLWDTSFDGELFMEKRLEVILERNKKINKILFSFITVVTGGCLVWVLPQFFNEDKTLSHPSGLDYRHQSPDYEILVTYEVITVIYGGASGIAFDMVLMALLTMEEIQLTHLKKSLAAIVNQIRANSEGEVELSHDVDKWEHGQYSKFEWLKESQLLKATKIEKNIRVWIKQHQKVMRIHQELRDIYYYPLCVQFSNIVLNICVTCFLRAVNALTTAETVVAALFSLGTYATFYINCRLGDKINETSATIFEEAFWQAWYVYPEHVKKIFHIIVMTTQRPLDIVAFDIYPLGARSFFKIFKTGYTFFMFLTQATSERHLNRSARRHAS